ncbi:DUF1638 domain-containing protein [Clostridium thailandense]|uniref:DUF1638 domain-containing protein n=1 Tax=Clostridium thailandense TaxID=2794346 RepID=UPI0039896A21
MEKVILACRTIEPEVKLAMEKTCVQYPVYWVESGLHNVPQKLHDALEENLKALPENTTVLMAFGFCGNTVLGLHTGSHCVIIPKADDCITLILGSAERRKNMEGEKGTYFLTPSWLKDEANIWNEYKHALNKYGEKRAKRIMQVMFKNYERIMAIETGTYDAAAFFEICKKVSADLELKPESCSGTTAWLEKLLTGPYDENFLISEPNSVIRIL